jgi:hypothetical protein
LGIRDLARREYCGLAPFVFLRMGDASYVMGSGEQEDVLVDGKFKVGMFSSH